MATLKVVLRKEEKADGTYPLAIRITKDRKSSYIYLEYSIKPTDWDEKAQRVRKTHPNSARLNNFLLKKLSEANDKALEVESQKDYVSSRAVRQKIKPSAGATFFAQAQAWLDELKTSGKYNQYTSEKPRIKHFKEFLGGDDIAFSDISVGMLDKFKSYLRGSQGVNERTAVNHWVTIRSVFSYAIKNQVTDPKYYPFGKGKAKIKFPDSIKVGLTAEEITKLEKVELPDEYQNHCRNLFLISFYFAGMRVSDVLRLKHSDFQNGRLHYAMGKNNKAGSLKIPEKAENILTQYKDTKHDLVFPELKRLDSLGDPFIVQRAIAFAASRIDKCLRTHVAPQAGIEKKLTMHIARHTFGNISGDRIPVQMLQKLYRHSKIETTIGYQANFIHKDADEALNAVLQF
ncbi:MAG TPA: site-specific integrase [Chitinophagaceae bacterium]|nr:site-specific integrase [Chitinophagaceae bacterium]